MICSTILFAKEATLFTPRGKRTTNSLKTKRVALWVFQTETKTTATHAGVSERLEPRYSSVAQEFSAAIVARYVPLKKQYVLYIHIIRFTQFFHPTKN